ncbi:MAG: LysR family transcriptional regulator [Acidobacteriota bacterium]
MDDAPDLEILRCFGHLHRERHLTRAARRAGLSQPAMSRALGRLRDVFGDPLFVRTPRGMLPTPRADALAPEIEAVVAAAAALVRPASFEPARLERTFVIATTDMFEADLVPGLVEALASAAPGVSLTTRPIDERADEALASGRLDLVIGVRQNVPPDAMAAQLSEDGFLCAVRGDHPGVGKRLTLGRFCELPHLQIAPRGEPGGAVDAALDALGLSRRIVARTHGFLAAPAIVASSDLVLTAPTRILRPLAGPFRLRLLPPPLPLPTFTIWQCWHPRVHEDPAHRWLRAMVAAAARRQ